LLLEGKKKVSTPKKLPDDVSNSLTNSVHQLAMNDPHPNLSASAFTGVGERVSGLNSFFYSGGRSTSDSAEGNKALTMSEKLQAARNKVFLIDRKKISEVTDKQKYRIYRNSIGDRLFSGQNLEKKH